MSIRLRMQEPVPRIDELATTLFNTGGPRSRTRTERLTATVLGASDGCLRDVDLNWGLPTC
jgi:hypothetical protein